MFLERKAKKMSRCFVTITPFGKEIKKRMIDLDMNQKDLAEAINVTPSYISDVFRGARSGVKIKRKICKTVGLEYDQLMKQLEERV